MTVLQGPSTILGRTAIKYFWPKIYSDLTSAAESTREGASHIPSHPKEVLDNMLAKAIDDSVNARAIVNSLAEGEHWCLGTCQHVQHRNGRTSPDNDDSEEPNRYYYTNNYN